MDWLELREDWGVEQKNSSEVNFYFGIWTLGVQWWLFCAEGHVNATAACHVVDTCGQDSLDVQDEEVEKWKSKAGWETAKDSLVLKPVGHMNRLPDNTQ